MASEVFTTEDVTLLDGTEVELRPLPIAKLRKFMRIWSEHIQSVSAKLKEQADNDELDKTFTEADLTEAQFDAYIKMCAMGLESQLKNEKTDKQFIAYLEDTLDEATIYKILEVIGGLQVGNNNPNLQTPPTSPEDGIL